MSCSDLMLGKDNSCFICTRLEDKMAFKKKTKKNSCVSLILKYNTDCNNNPSL